MKEKIISNITVVIVIIITGLLLLTVEVFNIQSALVYAQSSTTVKKTTTGAGSLDILLETSSNPIVKDAQVNFKVIFDQKGSNMVQNHIDYDFVITKNGKQLLLASGLAGQAGIPLHTAEGIVTIPYRFQDTGYYSVNVTVYGILFNQINPEYALFPIKVTAISGAGGVTGGNNYGTATTSVRN
jgi:hypothetical protein